MKINVHSYANFEKYYLLNFFLSIQNNYTYILMQACEINQKPFIQVLINFYSNLYSLIARTDQ